MNFVDVFFLAFAFLVIVSALMVIISKNPIQSALYLVLAFFGSSGLWIMLNAEFLGLMLILVYVGAVMTLFLFVVMTVNFKIHVTKTKHTEIVLGLLVFVILIGALLKAIHTTHYAPLINTTVSADTSNTHQLGTILYTQYVYPFEIAGILLLTAIIAAITLRGKAIDRKRKIIEPSDQIKVTAAARLKIIQMPAVKPVIEPAITPPTE